MDLTIMLKITTPSVKPDSVNVYVLPIGQPLDLEADFINNGKAAFNLQDPVHYAETVLVYKEKDALEESIIYLNPGNVDPTGEMTAPVANRIELKPNAPVKKQIDLYQYVPEHLYTDEFEMKVMYDEIESGSVRVFMKFVAESVDLLINILSNNRFDASTQKQAVSYLRKLPCDLNYKMPEVGESESDRNNRTSENNKQIEEFRKCWLNVKDSAEVKSLFKE